MWPSAGALAFLAPAAAKLVRVLEASPRTRPWLSLGELTAGPLWRGVDRWGNLSSERLCTRGVTRAVRSAAAPNGYGRAAPRHTHLADAISASRGQ